METHDIAGMLREKDPVRYKLIIDQAENYQYHDFKSYSALPKMQLVQDLEKFPELSELRQQVINGEFDESMFDDIGIPESRQGEPDPTQLPGYKRDHV